MSDLVIPPENVVAQVIDPEAKNVVDRIMNEMDQHLSSDQKTKLRNVLTRAMLGIYDEESYMDTLAKFANAKRIEGRTKRTVDYYLATLTIVLRYIDKPLQSWTADDVRRVISHYREDRGCNDTTVGNVKRCMSTFFAWLENEDYITKSPVKKVSLKINKSKKKEPFSEVELDSIRQACQTLRDRAIIELLNSSGMRVGELAGLKKDDVDLSDRSAYVTGKGNKSRWVYFSETAAKYLRQYLDSRNDPFENLFVDAFGKRPLKTVSAFEGIVKKVGERAGVKKCHPHRFRRTMATRNLDRGMPIEEIQLLLGHEKIETTLIYANVNNEKVKTNARMLM